MMFVKILGLLTFAFLMVPTSSEAQFRNRGGASISANPNVCYVRRGEDLCTVNLRWRTGRVGNAVVTVEEIGTRNEKIFACNNNGTGQAPWIGAGKKYVFKVYAVNSCTVQAFQTHYPLAQVTVQGR